MAIEDGIAGFEIGVQPLDVEFRDLGLTLPNEKQILTSVTGKFVHGRLTGILGPSGSGKTTFLMVLSGRLRKTSGEIFVNGQPADLQKYRGLLGFVPEEDIMLRMMTVEETLQFSARLRLPRDMSAAEKSEHVQRVMRLLKLGNVRDSIIGDEFKRGISFGERRRTNFGIELVARPGVLFVDDATSGLDSTMADEVMDALQRIAASGLTVVSVMHQPGHSIFKMLNDVMLVGEGGRAVYLGPGVDAVNYFCNIGLNCPVYQNPSEYFIDVLSGKLQSGDAEGDEIVRSGRVFQMWEEEQRRRHAQLSDDNKGAATTPVTKRRLPGFCYLMWLFTRRAFVQQWKELFKVFMDFVLIFLAAVFLCMTNYRAKFLGPVPQDYNGRHPREECRKMVGQYKDDPDFQVFYGHALDMCDNNLRDSIPTVIFQVTLTISFIGLAISMRVLGHEKEVYRREVLSTKTSFTYFLAKDISHIPYIMIAPGLLVASMAAWLPLHIDYLLWYVGLACLLFCCSGLGYLVSVMGNPVQASLAGCAVSMMWITAAGTYPTLPEWGEFGFLPALIPTVSPARWFSELLYVGALKEYGDVFDTSVALTYYEYKQENFGRDIAAMVSIGLALGSSAAGLLILVDAFLRGGGRCQKKRRRAIGWLVLPDTTPSSGGAARAALVPGCGCSGSWRGSPC